MRSNSKILILGALGQIGCVLTAKLRSLYGTDLVVASDVRQDENQLLGDGPFECIDANSYKHILECVKKYNVDTVYLMAALLSATSEKYPEKAWELNVTSLLNVLNLAKIGAIKNIFWPSSIAVFGSSTPKKNVQQQTIMAPTTVYGISKLVGERWCEYYFNHYKINVRSLRYPGIISWQSMPGGGTTDYSVEMFHYAVKGQAYTCFLEAHTELPMMYIDDVIDATINIMNCPDHQISVRSSYNLSGFSLTPQQLYNAIQRYYPNFSVIYKPDYRQAIADSWPNTIDDSTAQLDWGWSSKFNLDLMVKTMIQHLSI